MEFAQAGRLPGSGLAVPKDHSEAQCRLHVADWGVHHHLLLYHSGVLLMEPGRNRRSIRRLYSMLFMANWRKALEAFKGGNGRVRLMG